MIDAQPNRVMYGQALVELGERRPELVVLEADISKSTNTFQFEKRFPRRFFNVGVQEQNMVGMAAGLATAGFLPFVSTFVVFLSMRAIEQIRTSVAYPKLNVKIVATNAGVEIAGDGVTHQGVEDLAILRSIPNMTVVSPSDPVTTRKAVFASADHNGPVYMRLGRQTANVIHAEDVDFQLGKMIRLREGRDLTIIGTGNMVEASLKAADVLSARGITARVLDCHTVKPIDSHAICAAATETGGIVTAEDHNIIGGLGSAVCEVVTDCCPTRVKRVGLRDIFASSGRDHQKLLMHYGIDVESIVKASAELVAEKNRPGVGALN
jgi:transketolase